MPKFVLDREADAFARELSTLLNATVCAGVRLKAVITKPGRAVIGYKIDKHDLDPLIGIPLTLGPKPARGYLSVSFRLGPDREQRYLMVESSFMGIFLDPELERPIVHYDYERDKGDGYPEAHMQICADSEAWDELCAATRGDGRPLDRLHFPVGGRRYRPTLEDLLDFIITEKIADSRPGAAKAINDGRDGFVKRQLRAAIRSDPDTAIAVLREHELLPGSTSQIRPV